MAEETATDAEPVDAKQHQHPQRPDMYNFVPFQKIQLGEKNEEREREEQARAEEEERKYIEECRRRTEEANRQREQEEQRKQKGQKDLKVAIN